MDALPQYRDKTVLVVTTDGRILVGCLAGFDNRATLILKDCIEREFEKVSPCTEIPLGLFVVRGDSIAMIADVDSEKDAKIDYSTLVASPLKKTVF